MSSPRLGSERFLSRSPQPSVEGGRSQIVYVLIQRFEDPNTRARSDPITRARSDPITIAYHFDSLKSQVRVFRVIKELLTESKASRVLIEGIAKDEAHPPPGDGDALATFKKAVTILGSYASDSLPYPGFQEDNLLFKLLATQDDWPASDRIDIFYLLAPSFRNVRFSGSEDPSLRKAIVEMLESVESLPLQCLGVGAFLDLAFQFNQARDAHLVKLICESEPGDSIAVIGAKHKPGLVNNLERIPVLDRPTARIIDLTGADPF